MLVIRPCYTVMLPFITKLWCFLIFHTTMTSFQLIFLFYHTPILICFCFIGHAPELLFVFYFNRLLSELICLFTLIDFIPADTCFLATFVTFLFFFHYAPRRLFDGTCEFKSFIDGKKSKQFIYISVSDSNIVNK